MLIQDHFLRATSLCKRKDEQAVQGQAEMGCKGDKRCSIGKTVDDAGKKMLERVNNEVEGVFSKRSKHYLYVHIYILMCLNVFVFVIRSFYIPVVSHFH